MATVSAELDEETKRKAEAVLAPTGFSSASVIQLLFARIAKDGVMPFELSEPFDSDRIAAAVHALINKIGALPPDRQSEVGDFVEFVQQREELRSLRRDFAETSEPAFAKVWDNPQDAIYDDL
jgi:addiction module RelB/DinJ family antitoxin